MADLKNPKVIYFKGFLFLALGCLAAGLLAWETWSIKTTVLLVLAIWGFCRAYYFAFYVIQYYVDASFRFSGLWSFARYLARRRNIAD
jgi:hypothetical protein